MEELNYKSLFKYLIRNLKVILISIVISIVMCVLYILFIGGTNYKSSSKIYISVVDNSDKTILNHDINSYAIKLSKNIIESNTFKTALVDELKLDYEPSYLNDIISVKTDVYTNTLNIEINTNNRNTSNSIKNKIYENLENEIKKYYTIEKYSVIDNQDAKEFKIMENIFIPVVFFLFAGGLVGGLIVIIMYFCNNKINHENDINNLNLSKLKEYYKSKDYNHLINLVSNLIVNNSSKVYLFNNTYSNNVINKISKIISEDKKILFVDFSCEYKTSFKDVYNNIDKCIVKSKNYNTIQISDELDMYISEDKVKELLNKLTNNYDYIFININSNIDMYIYNLIEKNVENIIVLTKTYETNKKHVEKLNDSTNNFVIVNIEGK